MAVIDISDVYVLDSSGENVDKTAKIPFASPNLTSDEKEKARTNIGAASKTEVDLLDARMDEFASLPDGSTAGNAELVDIRIGSDGTTWPSAGDAVRGQIDIVDGALSNSLITINLSRMTYVQNGFIDYNGNFQSPASATHKIVKIDASNIKTVTFSPASALLNTLSFAVIKTSGGVIKTKMASDGSGNPQTFHLTPASGDILYVAWYNFATTPNPYYSSFTCDDYPHLEDTYSLLKYVSQSLSDAQKEIARNNISAADKTDFDELYGFAHSSPVITPLSELTFTQDGYVAHDGTMVSTGATNRIVQMDASNLSYIAFTPHTALNSQYAFGCIKDSNNNLVKVLSNDGTTNKQEFMLSPTAGYTLYVSWFNWATSPNPYYDSCETIYYDTLIETYSEEIRNLVSGGRYRSCANKPFSFSGKTLYFFGDSITYGYIAANGGVPAHQASNQYPKVFAQSVGASYTNYGVSGSTLSGSGSSSIYTKIQETTLTSCDVLFVAGGINDWQTGVDEATLKAAVTNICDYLTNNFSGEVIFITPINEAGRIPNNTPQQTVENVRDVITRVALLYGYSVVQGWEFPFPTIDDDASYISATIQVDKLHPTETGYKLYARALRNALC